MTGLEVLEHIDLMIRYGSLTKSELNSYIKCKNQIEKELRNNTSYKLALKNINKLVADAYNGEMSFELAINCINEVLKEVDWRNEDEIK